MKHGFPAIVQQANRTCNLTAAARVEVGTDVHQTVAMRGKVSSMLVESREVSREQAGQAGLIEVGTGPRATLAPKCSL